MKFTELELKYLDRLLFNHIAAMFDKVSTSDDKIQEKQKLQSVLDLNEGIHQKIQLLLKDIDN